ncbi:FadR/GntR family transcriptional regulator [Motiliproteus sp.]|uniref:FadR/GntR family transcriptional regulator n=1 Tax=Motiliproteus sp. TaxID=1898955 RepID=UPI003BAB1B89
MQRQNGERVQLSRSKQLAALLKQAIIEGEIRPGAKLDSERVLGQRFQTSRATVREAINELRGAGLVQTQHGGGSRCQNLLEPFFQDDSESISEPGLALQQQVLEMREMLEGEAAYYCADRASDDELQALAQEYARMGQSNAGANTLRQAKLDLGFHMRIAEQSHHLLVLSLSQLLYTRYFNAIYGVLSQTFKKKGRYPEHIGAQHRHIFQAIMDRDAEGARRAAREHIAYTRGLLLS